MGANQTALIDWEGLKLQYYKSDIFEIKTFIKGTGAKWNGNYAKKTKGWSSDKALFMENINKEATKEVTQTLIEQRAVLLTNMEKAKITGLNELAVRLNTKVKTMNVGTIGTIVSIFNNEQELDGDKVDNTTSVLGLRQKIKAAQAKKDAMEKKK